MKQTPSARCLKVGEEIKRALALYFQSGRFNNLDIESLNITITEVRMSPDLRLAKVYLLPMGGVAVKETLGLLDKEKPFIRKYIAQTVRLRYVPQLAFRNDESFDEATKIDALLRDPKVVRDLSDEDDH